MREGAAWNKREIERRIGMKGRKRKKLVLRRRGPDPAMHLHIVRVITSKKFQQWSREKPREKNSSVNEERSEEMFDESFSDYEKKKTGNSLTVYIYIYIFSPNEKFTGETVVIISLSSNRVSRDKTPARHGQV